MEPGNWHGCLQTPVVCAIERCSLCSCTSAGRLPLQATTHTSPHVAFTVVWPLQTTASECTLVALLAARARQMEGRPLSDTSRLVAYFSDQVRPCEPR